MPASITLHITGTIDRDAHEWGQLVALLVQRDLRENGIADALATPIDARASSGRSSRASLREALHALVAKMMTEADEADADGDFCCALTRRHDAVDVLAVLGEHHHA